MPVVVGWPVSSPRISQRNRFQGMNQDKGYCVGSLWNGSAAETWKAMVLSVALLRATDHDGPRSRIGAAAAVLCGEGQRL